MMLWVKPTNRVSQRTVFCKHYFLINYKSGLLKVAIDIVDFCKALFLAPEIIQILVEHINAS